MMMKKIRYGVFIVALASLMLTGCGAGSKDVENEAITVDLPGLGEVSGTFTGTLVDGAGVTAQLLIENGFYCVDVEDLDGAVFRIP